MNPRIWNIRNIKIKSINLGNVHFIGLYFYNLKYVLYVKSGILIWVNMKGVWGSYSNPDEDPGVLGS